MATPGGSAQSGLLEGFPAARIPDDASSGAGPQKTTRAMDKGYRGYAGSLLKGY